MNILLKLSRVRGGGGGWLLKSDGAALRVRVDALARRRVGVHCGGVNVWGCGRVGVRPRWRADVLTGEYGIDRNQKN